MKYNYYIIKDDTLDLDFQEIFEVITNELEEDNKIASVIEIYETFINNIEYYIDIIYDKNEFYEHNNKLVTDEIIRDWTQWLIENFGENWR